MRTFIFTAVVALTATPAIAQRTTANAITASEDAFGRAVGSERIGIYSQEDVRGFNPVEAGNARIEGLYFDQMSLPNNRLIDSSSIRVGYAAQAWPFPSPTGIVNLQLEKYEGKRVISPELESDLDGNVATTLQVKIPIKGDTLGISAGHGFRRSRIPAFRYINFTGEGINLTWRPTDTAEMNLFWSHFSQAKIGGTPILYPAGDFIPPEVERRDYIGQDWAHGKAHNYTMGATAKFPIGKMRLEMGLFRSIRDEQRGVADLALGVELNGNAREERIIVDENQYAGSTSGEIRLFRVFDASKFKHRLTAMVRGRAQERRYGGSDRRFKLEDPIVPGRPISLFNRFQVPEPTFIFGPKNESKVRQITFGAAYELADNKGLRIGGSIQRSDYRKTVDFGTPGVANSAIRARPWLITANATVPLSTKLSAYGGYVEGLEESPNAPDIAINANEAPPAARTRQKDFGLRYAITPQLTLITGAFQIDKPYYNLSGGRYGVLGDIRNRGIEISLAGRLAKGLTLVSGTLLLDPKLSGALVDAGVIRNRPVGALKRRSIVNLDWRPGGASPWSFDFAFDSVSGAPANALNSFRSSARNTFGLGTRYRFDMAGGKWLARAQMINIFNDYSWRVLSSGGFVFNQQRTLVFTLSADF